MTRKELLWFGIFELGMGLVAVERGIGAVCWNVGIGLIGWTLGRALR